ncbi:M23 family metallopeptidase [Calderihabitans maritimus]|uniref:Metalloendopeptidase n=1 Tax=Calderihabitans maritimus TaxID=1246530 RepID=A0A1Z5HMU8_9FIRM|nr:M23 family metallopeptidase [Calderihabitans maritimus]GAW90839.1 metalloendopeptidase [Calderihabitans maritimus]
MRPIIWLSSRKAKTAFLKITIIIALGIAIGYLYQNRDLQYEKLSQLPIPLVETCQELEADNGIPWELLAAFYQVQKEKGVISGSSEDTQITALALKLTKHPTNSFLNLLTVIPHPVRAFQIWQRYHSLKKVSYLFSKRYYFPVGKHKVYFMDTWGAERDGGKRRHQGTDIFAPPGTPLYAVTDGIIERKGWNRLGGWRIGLRGEDGIYYYYAHLQSYAPGIQQGDKIEKGTVLGYVGHTGNAEGTPDHLHFGMETPLKRWINPYPFLVYWQRKSSLL